MNEVNEMKEKIQNVEEFFQKDGKLQKVLDALEKINKE